MKRKFKKDWLLGYALVAPGLALSCACFVIPFFITIGISFFDVNFIRASQGFMGLKHYINFFTRTSNHRILYYSLVFLVTCLPGTLITAFAMAMLMHRNFRGKGVFRTLNILPWVVSSVSAAFMVRWVFGETNSGLINGIRNIMGLGKIFFVSDAGLGFWVIIIATIWKGVPMPFLLFLNGLQSIPSEYYEAAEIDGAGFMQKLRYVTIPFLAGQFRIVMVTTTIGLLGSIDIMKSIGGTGDYKVIGYAMYSEAFMNFSMSSGAAVGVIMMLINIVLATVYMRMFKLNAVEE